MSNIAINAAPGAVEQPGQAPAFPFPPPPIEPAPPVELAPEVVAEERPEHGFDAGLIQRLKAVHGEVFLVTVDPEGEMPALYFLFRKADRKVLGACAKIGQSDPMGAAAVLVENTILEGPREALQDSRIFSGVAQQLEAVNSPRITRVKNL